MAFFSLSAVFLCLCLFAGRGLAQDVNLTFPEGSDFVRARSWKATTIGKYIYMDGGLLAFRNGTEIAYPSVTKTFSIDCSSSWTPDSARIKGIDRPEGREQPRLYYPLFTDTENDAFYIWGGLQADGDDDDPQPELWRFDADGEGGGNWTQETPENADVFANIPPTMAAAETNTNHRAFSWGGAIATGGTNGGGDVSYYGGLVTFDYETLTFEERDDGDGYEGNSTFDGTIWWGTATFLPNFGTEGVFILLGGGQEREDEELTYNDWETVRVYDVASSRWYAQKSTRAGSSDDMPSARHAHCAVGVRDTTDDVYDPTSEIFVYGGVNQDLAEDYGTVYALSLPGFVWIKVSDEESRTRADHACVNVNGSSLLVSLGGYDVIGSNITFWGELEDDGTLDRDPLDRGIGIFDMSSLLWKDEYDADAGGYETNELIRTWYQEGNERRVEYETEELEYIFRFPGENPPSEDDGFVIDIDSDSDSSTPVGAIAGGVVGGVAGLAVVGGLVWLWLRRRRRGQTKTDEKGPSEVQGQGLTEVTGEGLMEVAGDTPKPPSSSSGLNEIGSSTTPYAEMEAAPPTDGINRPISELEGSAPVPRL